jgi:predicted nucleic acid-binding protein
LRERLVIDASISLAWSLDDETDSRADEALTIVEQSGALVPTLWTYEIANSLTHFVRRSRLDTVRAQTILSALRQLNIVAVPPEAAGWYVEANALAMKHDLTMYDAAYLHLAVATRVRLATGDKKLGAAATAEGVAF